MSVQFLKETDFCKVSYLHNIRIWIWKIAVNHPKTSKFNEALEYDFLVLLLQHMDGFLNNSQIEVFFGQWGNFFFWNFSHGIYSMYVPEGICMVGHTGNP